MKTTARFVIALMGISPVVGLGQVYTLAKLPKPRTGDFTGVFVNDEGIVLLDDGHGQWIWRPDSSLTPIPQPNGTINPISYCLTSNGKVAITTTILATQKYAAATYDPGSGTRFLTMPQGVVQSFAYAMNSAGYTAGVCNFENGPVESYLAAPYGTVTLLPRKPGYSVFTPHCMNTDGVIVGRADTAQLGSRVLVWSPQGGFADLGAPDQSLGQFGMFVNDEGAIAAYVFYSDFIARLAVYEPGKAPYVVEGPDKGFIAHGINEHGDVAGAHSFPGYSFSRGQIWIHGWPAGKWIDGLTDGSATGWKIAGVHGPNNKGQITGGGQFNGAAQREPFLLTPHSYNLLPSSIAVRIGRVDHGSASSLGSADGDGLGVRRSFVPTVASPVVSFEVSAKTASDSLYLWLKLRARTTGPAILKARLWDVEEQAWDTKYPFSALAGTDWVYGECIAKRRMERYMAEEGTVKAKIDVYPASFDAGFMAEFDQASFEYVPASG